MDVFVSEAEYPVQLWEPDSARVLEFIAPGDHVVFLERVDDLESSFKVISSSGRQGEILPGHFKSFRKVS